MCRVLLCLDIFFVNTKKEKKNDMFFKVDNNISSILFVLKIWPMNLNLSGVDNDNKTLYNLLWIGLRSLHVATA